MSSSCELKHDWWNAALTFGLCCGLVISYVPQHFRIIHKGSSEGFSPWFLLLGCTSAAAGFLNIVTLQWDIVKCCRVLSAGSCLEFSAGVVQIGLQWIMFNMIMVLYIIYYPSSLKYTRKATPNGTTAIVKTEEWALSIIVSYVIILHFLLCFFITIFLLGSAPTAVTTPIYISRWATFLGVSSAMLAAIQYAPQLVHTYRMKLVGALSIPMMCIQSPGAVLMVTSIALRPGTNWTSWITFAVAGIMQGSLLVMCLVWKVRQRRLGIDDFGHPLLVTQVVISGERDGDEVPGLVVMGDEDPAAVSAALAQALESAVETDLRTGLVIQPPERDSTTTETTPLLSSTKTRTSWWKRD